jgi:DNA invertase Pin-like site-specific DNA recombinase
MCYTLAITPLELLVRDIEIVGLFGTISLDSAVLLAHDIARRENVRVATYIRVSTAEQNSSLQVAELEQYISARGWQSVGAYEDVMSGAKSNRPGLSQLMVDASKRKFDAVVCWKLDRFGRSLVDCLGKIQTLEGHGVRFIAVTQGLDTDQQNPASRFLLHVLGAAAEFERSLIRERVTAGMKAARKTGKTLGRPRRVFNRDEVRELHSKGMSVARISQSLGIGIGTVHRTLAEVA